MDNPLVPPIIVAGAIAFLYFWWLHLEQNSLNKALNEMVRLTNQRIDNHNELISGLCAHVFEPGDGHYEAARTALALKVMPPVNSPEFFNFGGREVKFKEAYVLPKGWCSEVRPPTILGTGGHKP